MKTIQTTLAAMTAALFLSSALVAQNNDAPAPLSSQNGKQYTIGGKPQTIDIDFTDTTMFSNTWRYMVRACMIPGYHGMTKKYFFH